MRPIPFIGPSYQSRSIPVSCQRSINLYPEKVESADARAQWILVGVPGKQTFATLPNGPVRGIWKATGGRVFAVGGGKFYEVGSTGTVTERGVLLTSSGFVSISDNGSQVCLVDGDYGYIFTLGTNAFAQITDPDFAGADTVDFIDGYFLFNTPNTQQFQITALYDGSNLDALDFASSEALPDNLVGLIAAHREAWMFNTNSTEVYYNSGNADFPFERVQGATIEIGCLSASSIQKAGNAVFWLGSEKGTAMVFSGMGYTPNRISTNAVELSLQSVSDLSSATSWVYQSGGHSFYCLNIVPGTTWVYDLNTQQWHERQWRNPSTGEMSRDRVSCAVHAFGKQLAGDYETGVIYELSDSIYSDNGDPLIAERVSPHGSDSVDFMSFGTFQLDCEVGVGLDSGQGSDPQVMLSWSNDGGHSWRGEQWAPMGKVGEYRKRAVWRRLGRSKACNRVWKVRISDPVKRILIAAHGDFE